MDTVTEKAERWSKLDKAIVKKFRDDDGIVNEFALLYELRSKLPLHWIVFKQTASHLPAPARGEYGARQLFSRSGALSDDNGKMDPARLAVWTAIGVNYETCAPPWEKILERYLLKFRKGGKAKLHADDLGLLDDAGVEGEAVFVKVEEEKEA